MSNVEEWNGGLDALREAQPFRFEAPIGWQGHMEREMVAAS
jgi:hypothetical protein